LFLLKEKVAGDKTKPAKTFEDSHESRLSNVSSNASMSSSTPSHQFTSTNNDTIANPCYIPVHAPPRFQSRGAQEFAEDIAEWVIDYPPPAEVVPLREAIEQASPRWISAFKSANGVSNLCAVSTVRLLKRTWAGFEPPLADLFIFQTINKSMHEVVCILER